MLKKGLNIIKITSIKKMFLYIRDESLSSKRNLLKQFLEGIYFIFMKFP